MSVHRANGAHDRLAEHDSYTDPWPLLVARCRLLDGLHLTGDAVVLVTAKAELLTEPMREELTFHAIRLHLLADALSAVLVAGKGDQR